MLSGSEEQLSLSMERQLAGKSFIGSPGSKLETINYESVVSKLMQGSNYVDRKHNILE